MGLCNRCGEITLSCKCKKSGTRSDAKNVMPNQRSSVTDRWQMQYASSILNHDSVGRSKSTPPLTGKSPLLSQNKMCVTCKKSLQYAKSYLEGEQRYCESCHGEKFSPGTCMACEEAILPQDVHIAHGSWTWHQRCFRCWSCDESMTEPLVDLERRPCCEPCMMRQAGQRHSQPAVARPSRGMTNSPISSLRSVNASPAPTLDSTYSTSPESTLGSAYSASNAKQSPLRRPPIDSHLFRHYEKSLQSSSSSSSSIPQRSDTPVPTTSTPLRSGSPASARKPSPSTNVSTPLHGHRNVAKPTEKRRICCECEKPLSGQRVKLPTPKGDKWYHDKCLKCTTCKNPFTGSNEDIVVDDKGIYHTKCHVSAPAKPPSPAAPRSSQVFLCNTCQKPITEKCLKNGTRLFHPQCFLCHVCHVVLPYDQPFYDIGEEAHCEECSNRITLGLQSQQDTTRTASSSSSPPPPQPQPQVRQEQERSTAKDTNPSALFKNRTSALPKLGGFKKCPRCNESIAIMDDTPGPKASRWHKKCLRCESCKKQMDSAAKVTEGSNGEWLVFCRTCTLKTDKHSSTRNRSYSQPLTKRQSISSVFQ